MEQLANELHAPIKKIKSFRKVISERVNEIWACDLVFMDKFGDENNGYKYILTVIDIYSRYGWAIPLKTKNGPDVAKALQSIITKSKSHPEKLWTDQGTDFLNKNVDTLRSKYNIDLYNTFGNIHNPVNERYNRTLKSIMYKKFTINGNHEWYDILDEIVNQYNNKLHRTIKMKPDEAFDNKPIIPQNIVDTRKTTKQLFKINDRVRISYKRNVFDKGYLPNWSHQIYKISEVLDTKPTTYKIKDERGDEIKGGFYAEELKKTNTEEGVYLVEKILKTRTLKGKKQNFVKFIGYDDSFNDWVDDDNTAHNLKDINKLNKKK